jgi:uncharacterized protein YjbI with pentapeptide repeats
MRRYLAGVMLGMVVAAPAWACSCRGPQSELEAVRGPAIIFRGTALAEDAIEPAQRSDCRGGLGPECAATPTVRFHVDTMFKGPAGREEVLIKASRQDGVNCGVSFRIGAEYLVGALGDSERGYRTDLCAMARPSQEQAYGTYRYRTEELRRALAAAPADAALRRALGEHFVLHADWENARALLREATAPELLVLLGEAELGLSHGEAALAIFDRALAAVPGLVAARKGRMATLLQLGRTDGFKPGSDFGGTEVRQLTLDGMTLTGSRFAAGTFHTLSVERAVLDGADFRRGQFYTLKATAAQLRQADFRHAWVITADLSKADLTGASFQWAKLQRVKFTDADLSGASMVAATLEECDLNGAKLTGVDFTGVRLTGSRLPGADLSGQLLAGAVLQGADLSGARLTNVDLRRADLSTQHAVTRLQGADLTGALLDGAILAGAQYDCKTRWPAGFDPMQRGAVYDPIACPGQPRPTPSGLLNRHAGPQRQGNWPVSGHDGLALKEADLSGHNLSNVDLRRTNFVGGSLRGASLAGAWLDNASFKGIDLTGADFSGVDLRSVGFHGGGRTAGLVLRNAVLDRNVIRTMGAALAEADLTGAVIAIEPKDWSLPFNPLERGAFFLKVPQGVARFGLPDLRGADLSRRNLFQADFTGVDLSGADLRGASLEQAVFSGANLAGVRFQGATTTNSTRWPAGFDPAAAGMVYTERVNSDTARWAQSNGGLARHSSRRGDPIAVPDLTGVVLDRVDWRAAWLENGRLGGASLTRARLESANLTLADLKKANLEGASLNDATLDGADLTGASLRRTDLRWASLRGARLADTDLTGALYDDHTVWPQGFDPAKRGAVQE